MIFKIYLAFVIVSLIPFALYFLRINEYLAEQGLRCVANMSTVKMHNILLYTFISYLFWPRVLLLWSYS